MTFKDKIIKSLPSLRLDISDSENEKIAYLELITLSDLKNREIIEKITQWRERYKTCFLSEFVPTVERTKQWLDCAVIQNENRLLFKIYTRQNIFVGHIGVIYRGDYLEYDYFILGVKVDIKDFALTIARKFLLWVIEIEKVDYILGNVRWSNDHAVDFHLRTGFVLDKKIPLRKIVINENEFRFEKDLSLINSDYNILEIRAVKSDLEKRL